MANITSGKTGRQISEVLGLKELKAKVKKLTGALVSDDAQRIVGSAAWYASTEVRHSAESVNVPHEVLKNIFAYSKPQTTKTGRAAKVSALVGLRKRGRSVVRPNPPRWPARSYAEWKARASIFAFKLTGGKGKVKISLGKKTAAGKLIGENLGTMWELGTSKQAPRPWFRPAIERAQSRVMMMLKDGYTALIERHAKANP